MMFRVRRGMVGLVVLVVLGLACGIAQAVELVRLAEQNWDEYVPAGKEVDCIYGDWVLRNDRIVCVVADAVPTRHANMTVRNVGGCIIDLTRRDVQSDQLSCYYAGGARYALKRVSDRQVVAPDRVSLSFSSEPAEGRPVFQVTYTLADGSDHVELTYTFTNPGRAPVTFEIVDTIRADRSFERIPDGKHRWFWVEDHWFRQSYALVPESGGVVVAATTIRYEIDGQTRVTLDPGKKLVVRSALLPAANLLDLKNLAALRLGQTLRSVSLCAVDSSGNAIPDAEVSIYHGPDNKQLYGRGWTDEDGTLGFALPEGTYLARVTALGRDEKMVTIQPRESTEYEVELVEPGYVEAVITNGSGGPTPCKVQFLAREGATQPYFGPETADTAIRNVRYSHNGTFRQALPPGRYDVVISYGPEHDAVFTQIQVERGRSTPLRARLVRSVQTPGWISADFHNHSSPSGDNTSSQLGRVQNLLCEQVEFAPCTEHNRISTYVPHLQRLGVEHLMATCSGIELTNNPGSVNHQNAFPLVMKPRTQDGGGPVRDDDPEVQIERLALWDGGSEKVVQQNHPDIGHVFYDKDGDGIPDGGFKKSIPFIDCIEVHPLSGMLQPPQVERRGLVENNRIFNWLQLLNQGYRIPGVVNTDSHYNFHESGFLRNYVKSPTDDPAKIQVLDVVHAVERGNVVMTSAPFLEVYLRATQSDGDTKPASGTAGDDVRAPGGTCVLHVRVQCANWYDIDRVQVYFNGRPVESLNYTRATHREKFGSGVVKFDEEIPLSLPGDTHVIVMAVGEKSRLGVVQGPSHGNDLPVAVSNPIYVDVDGGGFRPNGDTLGAPLPVKGGRPAQ